MKITNQIKEILVQWLFEENKYFLPQINLERKTYLEINEVLTSLWGKWNRWAKAHLFDWTQEELESSLEQVLQDWETTTLAEIKKQFQYFPTPKDIAEKLVELAEIKDWDFILEPSAWKGAISDIFPQKNKKTLVELDINNFIILKEKEFFNDDCRVINRDFLQCYIKDLGKFQKIIANPPFSKNQDVKHILHMYDLLKEWWRIVAIASSSIMTKETKLHKELKLLNPEFIELSSWDFKESWTMVKTCIVIINKLS